MVKLSGAYGGLSDNDYRLLEGQFPYGENINFSKQPEVVKLGPKPIQESDITSTGKQMFCGLEAMTGSLGNVFFMGEDGYIIDIDGNTVRTGTDDIVACIQYRIDSSDYIIWGTEVGDIGRIKVSEAYNSSDWTSEASYDATRKEITTGVLDQVHFLKYNKLLYVSGADEVQYIQIDGTLMVGIDYLDGEVTGITENGQFIRIYTSTGQTYIWDGFNKSPDATISSGLSTIRGAYGFRGTDWVVGGSGAARSQLLTSNGYSYNLMNKATKLDVDIYEDAKGKFEIIPSKGNNWIVEYQGLFYALADDGIMQFGKEYPTSPFAYNKLITRTDDGTQITQPRCIFKSYSGSKLYFYVETSTEKLLSSITLSSNMFFNRAAEGYFYLPRVFAGNTKQVFEKAFLRADIPEDTTMTIKYSTDGDGVRTTLRTLTYSDTVTDTGRKETKFRLTKEIIFNEIQFKVEMTTTDASVTPSYYEIEFYPIAYQSEGQ